MFISFEGGEGSGKSTQIRLFYEYFKSDFDITMIREPGGTELGEKIRSILVESVNRNKYNKNDDKNNDKCDDKNDYKKFDIICSESELLLFYASRINLVKKIIEPALKSNKVVICDRFIDSTYAYQGYGRGIDLHIIDFLNEKLLNDLIPNRTYYLSISPEEGLRRSNNRQLSNVNIEKQSFETKFENIGIEFHKKVNEGFENIFLKNKKRFIKIDSTLSSEEIFGIIRNDFLNLVNLNKCHGKKV